MPSLLRSVTLLCAASVLVPALRADEDRMLRVHLSPGRWHHVSADTPLVVAFAGVEADLLQHVRLSTLAVTFDGIDITSVLFDVAARQGGVTWTPLGATLALQMAVPLPPGRHVLAASYQVPTGGTWRATPQVFFVYDPVVAPLARVDRTPPAVAIDPEDQSFVEVGRPVFTTTVADENSGVDTAGGVVILFDNVDVTAQCTRTATTVAFQPAGNLSNTAHTLTARVTDRAGNLTVANATVLVFAAPRNPWFFAPTNQAHPLGHEHHQYQLYSTQLSQAYFHHGVDIRRPSGTPAYAPRGGRVTQLYYYNSPPLYFEVEITDTDGYRWQFHHIAETTVPQAVRSAYTNGTPIAAGQHIGDVVAWPVSAYGMLYHHVHLNVIGPDGRFMNPLNFMHQHADTAAPVVRRVFVGANAGSSALNDGTNGATVSGRVDVWAECEDLIPNEPYQLTLYKLTWELEEVGNTRSHHLPETTFWRFNFLPGGSSTSANVHDVFKPSLSTPIGTVRTQGDYNARRFVYTVTNRVGSGVNDASGYWDTAQVRNGLRVWPNGQYRLTVRAYDGRGNSGSRSITVTVNNP
jgi:hypothetical protein